MDNYAGIDVSLELSSVCVVDSSGKIVRETKVASEPEALLQHFADLGLPVIRVGLEAGLLSQWLREGLVDAGFEVVLLETLCAPADRPRRPRYRVAAGREVTALPAIIVRRPLLFQPADHRRRQVRRVLAEQRRNASWKSPVEMPRR